MGSNPYHNRPLVSILRRPFGDSMAVTRPIICSLVQRSSPAKFPSPISTQVSPSMRTRRCSTYVCRPFAAVTCARRISPRRGARFIGVSITLSLSPSIYGRMLTPEGVKRTSFSSASSRASSGINMSLSTLTFFIRSRTRSSCNAQRHSGTHKWTFDRYCRYYAHAHNRCAAETSHVSTHTHTQCLRPSPVST